MTKFKREGQERRWYIQQFEELKERLAGVVEERDQYRKRAEAAQAAIEETANLLKNHSAVVRDIFEKRALAAEEVVEIVRDIWHDDGCSSKGLAIQEHLCDCSSSDICKALVKYDKTNEHWHAATAGGKKRCVDLHCSGKRV